MRVRYMLWKKKHKKERASACYTTGYQEECARLLHTWGYGRARASATYRYLGMRKSVHVRYIPGVEEERAHPLHTWG
jgi:hypothetical protein